jgi:hypothetical protein
LGEGKISYDEYDNLHTLYRLNYQKFIEYNIRDVELILRFEDKLKLLELAVTLAYDTKSNFEDKEETKATIRCIPFAQIKESGSCIYCKSPSQGRVIFARSY